MREMTPDARWVLVRTFVVATLVAVYAGAVLGLEWVVPAFKSSAILTAALLCWIRVGIG